MTLNIRLFRKAAPRLPAVFVAAGIWFLSSQSVLPTPKGIPGLDKLQHVLAYCVLALTSELWFSDEYRRRHGILTFFIIAAVSSVYGIIDEVHQFFVPGRDCNFWDWTADTLGAVLGGLAFKVIVRKIH
jgi:VanZ family protein